MPLEFATSRQCLVPNRFAQLLGFRLGPTQNGLVRDLNLNSLLVKCQNDNPSPGAVTGGN